MEHTDVKIEHTIDRFFSSEYQDFEMDFESLHSSKELPPISETRDNENTLWLESERRNWKDFCPTGRINIKVKKMSFVGELGKKNRQLKSEIKKLKDIIQEMRMTNESMAKELSTLRDNRECETPSRLLKKESSNYSIDQKPTERTLEISNHISEHCVKHTDSNNILMLIGILSFVLLLNTNFKNVKKPNLNTKQQSKPTQEHKNGVNRLISPKKESLPNVPSTPKYLKKVKLEANETLDVENSEEVQSDDVTQSTPAFVCPLITDWKPNITYLICSNVSRIYPPVNTNPVSKRNPNLISFMIPPDILDTSLESKS